MNFLVPPSPCVAIRSRFFADREVWIKRDDLLHSQVSGNKFRKLKYPLLALNSQPASLVTMGGIWSNHVHATAHAAALCGYRSLALIRAAEGMNSAMLDDCRALGMQLRLIDRQAYRCIREQPEAWRQWLPNPLPNPLWLPEGGSTAAALRGVAELVAELPFFPDVIVVACGTGATLAGLLAGLQGRGRVIGVVVLKDAGFLPNEVARLLQEAGHPAYDNYDLLTEWHHGGYGKAPASLRDFCTAFAVDTGVSLEPTYTGKLFYALHQLIERGSFTATQSIMAVHTGGLQGARGY